MKGLTVDQHALLGVLADLTAKGSVLTCAQLAKLVKKSPSSVAKQLAALLAKGYISSTSMPLEVLAKPSAPPRPLRKKAGTWADAKLRLNYEDGVYTARRVYLVGDVYADHTGAAVVLVQRKGPRKLAHGRSAYYWNVFSENTFRKRDLTEVALDCRFSKIR